MVPVGQAQGYTSVKKDSLAQIFMVFRQILIEYATHEMIDPHNTGGLNLQNNRTLYQIENFLVLYKNSVLPNRSY
jgi:hypothetical protein